jgi:hypothetical protein
METGGKTCNKLPKFDYSFLEKLITFGAAQLNPAFDS